MKNFNIPQIKKGEFIFELANEMEIGFLIQYYAPFTGGTICVIPSGFKFTIRSSMRDDAFYMSPIANNKDVEDNLYLKMKELSKSSDPNLANRIQGFSFYITETQLRSSDIIFLKGNRDILFDIIDKQKEQTEYFKDFNPFEDDEWVKTNLGSTYSNLEECGKPKVLKTNTDICPCCGGIMRRVYWGEITPEILQLKKEHKIFIGEDLYGKDNDIIAVR